MKINVHHHVHDTPQMDFLAMTLGPHIMFHFCIIPVYLQSVQAHSVNWLKEVDECLREGRSLALFYS
jgi:hypothetical protein